MGVPGGGYYRGHVLHGALGVVQKTMDSVTLKRNFKKTKKYYIITKREIKCLVPPSFCR